MSIMLQIFQTKILDDDNVATKKQVGITMLPQCKNDTRKHKYHHDRFKNFMQNIKKSFTNKIIEETPSEWIPMRDKPNLSKKRIKVIGELLTSYSNRLKRLLNLYWWNLLMMVTKTLLKEISSKNLAIFLCNNYFILESLLTI